MFTSNRCVLAALVLVVLVLLSCDTEGPAEAGFVVSLAESGDVVLSDEHVASYIWEEHRIVLTPQGVRRWESYVEYDNSRTPPIPKQSVLSQKEFVMTIENVEMYRGHFWTMTSSMMRSGVLIYDTLMLPRDGIRLSFQRLDGEPEYDPRSRPEIEMYFRERGKLRGAEQS